MRREAGRGACYADLVRAMSSAIITHDRRADAVRGSTVEPARRFALQQRGTPAWDDFLAALDDRQRELLDQPISRRDWYDLRLYADFIEVAAGTLGADDPEAFLRRAGRFVFDDGVNSLYRAFFRIATPSFVIRGSAMLWGLFFRGARLSVVSRGRRDVHAVLRGGSFCSRPLCVSIGGGMFRALEHGGAREVALDDQRCRSEGGGECEFRFSWR
jgi:hypothetical protein